MSGDRELLELAARAAGYRISHFVDDFGSAYVSDDLANIRFYWRPRLDDGDALRLAVKLNIDIGLNQVTATAIWIDMNGEAHEVREYVNEEFEGMAFKLDATRRAIVRAAAEIGKVMP